MPSLELVNVNWLTYELCMLIVTISYHHDIVMLTITIMIAIRLEPIMLKNSPIIPSRTSQNFYPLFCFIPIAPPIIPFLFCCDSDNMTVQE